MRAHLESRVTAGERREHRVRKALLPQASLWRRMSDNDAGNTKTSKKVKYACGRSIGSGGRTETRSCGGKERRQEGRKGNSLGLLALSQSQATGRSLLSSVLTSRSSGIQVAVTFLCTHFVSRLTPINYFDCHTDDRRMVSVQQTRLFH
ncbi:hypothetical protein LSTR_LSTR004164 [Laodelphax striatellus]|uniref:Uncharacterized protein n=1 Tax=Laodelphax striatellus TaxID=195883 RepID=A0A482X9F4_LAOST|nr:hypothetical protein LSTR_LSTR004164 [Laodelphax striatellus]